MDHRDPATRLQRGTAVSRVAGGDARTGSSPWLTGIGLRLAVALSVVGILTCDLFGPGNAEPEAVGTIADIEVQVDSAVTVDVASRFMDPDGDSLRYVAASSDPGRASVAVAGSMVTVTGVAAGSAAVTVTATDPEGLWATQRFGVKVPNRAPEAVGTIADLVVQVDSAAVVGLSSYFADPDGDALTYGAASSDLARATVAVAGDAVTVTGVAKGGATVTVTAKDGEGLAATQSFAVTVPNRGPVAVGTVEELEVEVDSVAVVEVPPYFADPDGDALEYAAKSSDAGRATVALAGDSAVVTGVAKGAVVVTLTATDTEGLTAEQSFAVTVPNRGPGAVGAIADVVVEVDSAVVVEVAGGFADPDGDALVYAATSADPGRATVAVTGSEVTVTGVAKGRAVVTVTATDPEGLTAEQSFEVTVPNRGPGVAGAIADVVVEVDSAVVVEVAGGFADPDGDALVYAATSADPGRATVSVTGSEVTVTGVAKGRAMVTVAATDPEGLTAEQSFEVTVPNRGPGVAGAISDVVVEVDSAVVVEVAGGFADPDGDALVYAATSADPGRATVAVSGSEVTVTGVAKGRAVVTVAATDPEGLTATQSFAVTVPNRGPGVVGAIADVVVEVDSAVVVGLSSYFADPDGDALTYGAASSDLGRATVAVAGDAVTVTGVAKGGATVTVTAKDGEGLAATQSFAVTVPNRGPVAVGTVEELEVEVDSVAVVEVPPYFADPDGDALEYAAKSSDAGRAAVALAGDSAVVTGVAKGAVVVTLTATDPEGLTAEQSFEVTVPNRGPGVAGAIADVVVEVDSAVVVEVAGGFADPDGDALVYAATSADPGRATVSVTGSEVTVTGVAKGRAVVTVAATDPEGLTATQSFAVTVPNRGPGAVGAIADVVVEVDSAVVVEVAGGFADPDGDALVYAATSADPGRATVAVTGSEVTVTGVAKGRAMVTVAATDPEGLTAEQSFEVTVPNRGPGVAGAIADVVVEVDSAVVVEVAGGFADPDGDALVYAATSADPGRATVSVTGSEVTVTGVAKGRAVVTVAATDPEGLTATQSFAVTVPNRGPGAVGTIRERVVELRGVLSVDVSSHFADPDGDDLVFSAVSSRPGIASVNVSRSVVTVNGLALGTATVTVTARDDEGLAAEQRFTVRVRPRNRAPQPVGFISDLFQVEGTEVSVDVEPHFVDPDGDPLEYAAVSSDTEVATVSTSNGTVIVAGESVGTATITVTATDPGGLTATQSFDITFELPNQTPQAVGTIADMEVEAGSTVVVEVARHFADPDGDALVYAATSSDHGTATVAVSGSAVTVTGVAKGRATVTVVATDPGGLTATQSFDVTIRESNQAPVAVGTIPNQSITQGGSIAVDAATYFTDPDDDPLSYSATSSNTSRATVSASSGTLSITGSSVGTATITVTATDPGGLTATQSFQVAVAAIPNRAPQVDRPIDDINAEANSRYSANLSSTFSDPDGDALSYTASSNNTAVASASISGATIHVDAVAPGSATVSVTATDPGGLSATDQFTVTVASNQFTIALGFTSAVTEQQRSTLRGARDTWEAVLTDTELSDVSMPSQIQCLGLVTDNIGTIDDHFTMVTVRAIDGASNILAQAGYCYTRTADGTPIVSATVYDEADIGGLLQDGTLDDVALHEYAHGLGFASPYFSANGLLDSGSDPHFTGALAVAAFDAAGGTTYTGSKVPLSSDHSHWREDVLETELMTPSLGSGLSPFSAITIQAMADLGYTVDVSQADSYQLPSPGPPPRLAAKHAATDNLHNDVVATRVIVLADDGGVVRVIPPPPGSPVWSFPQVEVQPDTVSSRPDGSRVNPAGNGTMWRRVR